MQLFQQLIPAEQDADVRTVELVGGAREKIAADRLDVDQAVRGVMDRVDEAKGSGVPGDAANGRHVIYRADRVRGGAYGYQSSSLVHEAGELLQFQPSRLDVHRQRPHRYAKIQRQRSPRVDVTVVVEFGDDDLVPRP